MLCSLFVCWFLPQCMTFVVLSITSYLKALTVHYLKPLTTPLQPLTVICHFTAHPSVFHNYVFPLTATCTRDHTVHNICMCKNSIFGESGDESWLLRAFLENNILFSAWWPLQFGWNIFTGSDLKIISDLKTITIITPLAAWSPPADSTSEETHT